MGGELVEVSLTASSAAALLKTTFHHAASEATGQSVVRASDYSLPVQVEDAVAAVYGMHGLPLPPRKSIRGPNPFPPEPVNVKFRALVVRRPPHPPLRALLAFSMRRASRPASQPWDI